MYFHFINISDYLVFTGAKIRKQLCEGNLFSPPINYHSVSQLYLNQQTIVYTK